MLTVIRMAQMLPNDVAVQRRRATLQARVRRADHRPGCVPYRHHAAGTRWIRFGSVRRRRFWSGASPWATHIRSIASAVAS